MKLPQYCHINSRMHLTVLFRYMHVLAHVAVYNEILLTVEHERVGRTGTV